MCFKKYILYDSSALHLSIYIFIFVGFDTICLLYILFDRKKINRNFMDLVAIFDASLKTILFA